MEDIKRFEIVDSYRDISPLFKKLLANSTAMGFEFISFWGIEGEDDVIKDTGCPCIAASWPGDFVQRYVDQAYHEIDPLVHVAPASDTTVKWNTVRDMNNDFFNEVATFGLRDGMTIPIHIGNRLYLMSFATNRNIKIRKDEQSTLEGMGFRFLQDYMRAERRPGSCNREETDTKILQMALSGFSDDAIASFIGTTERYVSARRRDAMENLGRHMPYGSPGGSSRMIGISTDIKPVSPA